MHKALAALSTTKVVKFGSIREFLLDEYKNQEDYIEIIKETPDEKLEEVVLWDVGPEGRVWSSYFESHCEMCPEIPDQPMRLRDFMALLSKSASMAQPSLSRLRGGQDVHA